MKANRLKWLPIVLAFISVSQVPARQAEEDRKLLAGIRSRAQAGDALAQEWLSYVLYRGKLGVAEDDAEAVKWCRKAAEQGDARAQFTLGFFYEHGVGAPTDVVEAVKWFRRAAEQNDAAAQFILSGRYSQGKGVSKDEVEAIKWLRKAAEQNYADAEDNLGAYYLNGQGATKDYTEAVKWFRRAMQHGSALAQSNLGSCFAEGKGVEKDEAEAAKLYRGAAEQNLAVAESNLGGCYEDGTGVPQDYGEAVKWYRKAAEQDYDAAQFNLGVCYASGKGVATNKSVAAEWFRKAAEQNLAPAQYCLAARYINGDGVVRNYVEGYKWLLLAAAQGQPEAKERLNSVEMRLNAEQIGEGQKMARAFTPRDYHVPRERESTATSDSHFQSESSGTGFFITEDGYLITSEHVVRGGTQVTLITKTGQVVASVIRIDTSNDLALLKVNGKFSPLPVSSSRAVRMGSTVATVGFPNVGLQGFAPKLAKGEIASLAGAQDDPRYFQISLPTQPGNSGGALVEEHGNVIGVVSAKLNPAAALASSGALPENVNYAVKSSFLLSFLESVPDVAANLKEPSGRPCKFEDVVKSAADATALVLVY